MNKPIGACSTPRRWSSLIGPHGGGNGSAHASAPIGLIQGEGVGVEVTTVAMEAIAALRQVSGHPLPTEVFNASAPLMEGTDKVGTTVIDFCGDIFARQGAVLAGPVSGRFVYQLRREIDLFCKLVPLRIFPELANAMSLKHDPARRVDIMLVRDNAGGLYQGGGAIVPNGHGRRVAQHQFTYTEQDIERIVRVGAAVALGRSGRLHVVVKDGGVTAASQLWREVGEQVAASAGIKASFLNIDFAVYELLRHAENFDVIVAPNMFGDILADLGGLLMGSRGNTFSGNYDPDRQAVYQTNHGAAHDLAGKDVANPVGHLFALAMLLHESFGLTLEADRIERAVRQVWASGWRTADLAEPGCGTAGTRQFGSLVAAAIAAPERGLA